MLDKPARKIKNNYGKKNTGYFPSKKNGRGIAYESLLERDYMYLLEYDDDVISYLEQPITLEYVYLNRKRSYTPDIKVERNNKIQIIEIKPYEKLKLILEDDKFKTKLDVAANYCLHNQFEFKIVTDMDIRNGSLLNNIMFLHRYANIDIPAIEKLKIKNELAFQELELNILVSRFNNEDTNKIKVYIFSMIYHKIIKTNLDKSITMNSVISL